MPRGAAGGRPDPGRRLPGRRAGRRVVGYVAPKLLGAGPAALADAGVVTIAEAIDLELIDVTRVGPDLRFTARAAKREG